MMTSKDTDRRAEDNRTKRLQRSIIAYSALGILIVSAVVSAASMAPMYKLLRQQNEQALLFAAQTRAMAVGQYVSRSKDTALQVTSRTRIRQKLEQYNRGELTRDEVAPFTTKALREALRKSEQAVGITRLDQRGGLFVSVGIPVPEAFWGAMAEGEKHPRILGPVQTPTDTYLLVAAPIVGEGKRRVGTDFVLFKLDSLQPIVEDHSGLGESGEIRIARKTEHGISLLRAGEDMPTQADPDAVPPHLTRALQEALAGRRGTVHSEHPSGTYRAIAYSPIEGSDWGITVSMDANELDASVREQVIPIVLVILGLTIAGLLGMVVILRPLTGRVLIQTNELAEEVKRKTAALTEKETRMQAIVENAPDAIISIDERGLIEQFNPAAERIFGYSAAEVMGKNVSVLMPEPHQSQHDGYLAAYRRTGQGKILGVGAREVEGRHADGTLFPMELTVGEVKLGGDSRFTGIMRDITQRKKAERELADRYTELEHANQQLKAAQNQLLQSEKMASIGQLAAGVAHEINNPVGYINANVSSLRGYLEDIFRVVDGYAELEGNIDDDALLQRVAAVKNEVEFDYLRDDVFDLISESQEGVSRVKQIVQDLKDFAHVEEAQWQWADLHKGLDSTLNIAHNEIKYKAEVVKEYGELPQVECIASQLNQVFMNLLVNAAHAIEAHGTITLRTGTNEREVWIAVSDTGKGIPEDVRRRIFEPFFTTKPVGKGTGLGLSLAYGIVDKHGGRIEIESEVNKGTTFTVWLPIRQTEKDANAEPGSQAIHENQSAEELIDDTAIHATN